MKLINAKGYTYAIINRNSNQTEYYVKSLYTALTVVLVICALLIPIVTAILHPEEFRTNAWELILGITMFLGGAFTTYIFSLGKPLNTYEMPRRLIYYAIIILTLVIAYIGVMKADGF